MLNKYKFSFRCPACKGNDKVRAENTPEATIEAENMIARDFRCDVEDVIITSIRQVKSAKRRRESRV